LFIHATVFSFDDPPCVFQHPAAVFIKVEGRLNHSDIHYDTHFDIRQTNSSMPLALNIDGDRFTDKHGREVLLRGINLASDMKFPATPYIPSHVSEDFFDGNNVSFVGRPFPLEDADTHFRRLRNWGYNTLRYLYTWEAIEGKGPYVTIRTKQL
jgi:hypothetical protein